MRNLFVDLTFSFRSQYEYDLAGFAVLRDPPGPQFEGGGLEPGWGAQGSSHE